MNLSTVKWDQWDKTQSREQSGLFICVCTALCTIVAHNIAQNRPDNFPSYPPDNHHCSDDVYLREGGTRHRPTKSPPTISRDSILRHRAKPGVTPVKTRYKQNRKLVVVVRRSYAPERCVAFVTDDSFGGRHSSSHDHVTVRARAETQLWMTLLWKQTHNKLPSYYTPCTLCTKKKRPPYFLITLSKINRF